MLDRINKDTSQGMSLRCFIPVFWTIVHEIGADLQGLQTLFTSGTGLSICLLHMNISFKYGYRIKSCSTFHSPIIADRTTLHSHIINSQFSITFRTVFHCICFTVFPPNYLKEDELSPT